MTSIICQSCGLPLTRGVRGTNRDGSENNWFCRDCFGDGRFSDPHLTPLKLERRLLVKAREHNEIILEEVLWIIRKLPELQRWKRRMLL